MDITASELLDRDMSSIMSALESFYNFVDILGVDDEEEEEYLQAIATEAAKQNLPATTGEAKPSTQTTSAEDNKKSKGVRAVLRGICEAIADFFKRLFGGKTPDKVEVVIPRAVEDPDSFLAYFEGEVNKIINANNAPNADPAHILQMIRDLEKKADQYFKELDEHKDDLNDVKPVFFSIRKVDRCARKVATKEIKLTGAEQDIIKVYQEYLSKISKIVLRNKLSKSDNHKDVDNETAKLNKKLGKEYKTYDKRATKLEKTQDKVDKKLRNQSSSNITVRHAGGN